MIEIAALTSAQQNLDNVVELNRELWKLRDSLKRKDKYIRAFVAYFDEGKTITPAFIEEARKELSVSS